MVYLHEREFGVGINNDLVLFSQVIRSETNGLQPSLEYR